MAKPQPSIRNKPPATPAPATDNPAMDASTDVSPAPAAPAAPVTAAAPAAPVAPAAAEPKVRKARSPSVSVAHLYKDATIDENIPVPVNVPVGGSRGRQGGYPFARLTKDGQSFFVPKSAENPTPVKRLGSSVASMNKKTRPHGYQYICQPFNQDNGDGTVTEGARVWRVAYTPAAEGQSA